MTARWLAPAPVRPGAPAPPAHRPAAENPTPDRTADAPGKTLAPSSHPIPRPRPTPVWTLALALVLTLTGVGACGPDTSGDRPAEAGAAQGSEAARQSARSPHAGDHPEGHPADHRDDEHGDHHPGHDAGHDPEHTGEPGVVELSPEAVRRIGLETAPAAFRPLGSLRTTTGTVGFDEERIARVAPRLHGRLVRVPGRLGAGVRSGETLAVLDSVELGEAKAAFLRARARREVARRRFDRQQALLAERITSEQEALDAEASYREASADLAAARETLLLLGLSAAALEALSWEDPDASLAPVTAPFTGKVVTRHATLGELVGPEDTLFTVADLSQVWLWVDLYERDLARVRPGEEVQVRLDAYPGRVFRGRLTYVADQLDPESRTARARVDLPNPDRLLKPGMFARVAYPGGGEGPTGPVLTVPRGALQRDGGGSVVFVRTAPGRFERRTVEAGRVDGELAEILSGLGPGEEVVTEGSFLLRSQDSADQLGGHHHH